MKEGNKDLPIIDLVAPLASHFQYLDVYRKGGVNILGATVSVNDDCFHTMLTLSKWLSYIAEQANQVVLIKSVEDIMHALAQKRLGIIFHFQNTAALQNRLELLEVYYGLGVRLIQLTYNNANNYGYGCEAEADLGLTKDGEQLVAAMNQLGILVDVSHAGYKTALDAIAYSTKPVILSHSNAYNLCPSGRNVPDEVIKAVAKQGGCIGINAFPALVSKVKQQPSVDELIDHIDHISQLIGVDHIALGLDYYVGQWPYVSDEVAVANYNSLVERGVWNPKNYPKPPHKYPKGLETPDKVSYLIHALLQRGYQERDIRKIMSQNLFRLFQTTWA